MNIRLGDIYSLKNHPYTAELNNIKIAGLATMTPPILVVSEILNTPKQHDTETGLVKSGQVKCIFYSHKTHKFENLWFNMTDIKLIEENKTVENRDDKINEEIVTKNVILNKFAKATIIEEVKKLFLNKQVLLKSCDLELGKLKSTFSQSEYKPSDKITAHLDFLPPVMTVIDVKVNDEKVLFNPKSGNQKKIISFYLLKCKWYNSSTSSFSEDFIPVEAVQKVKIDDIKTIEIAIKNKNIFRYDLTKNDKIMVNESGKALTHVYIQPLELIFNHYKYQLKYYDIFRDQYSKMDLSNIILGEDNMTIQDLIIGKIPEYSKDLEDYSKVKDYIFKTDIFYRIIYRDLQGNTTKRIIYVKEFIQNKVIIADCLLRKGEERHFRIDDSAILKLEILGV